MAFADPQKVTINAVEVNLPRISSGENKGSFAKDDQTIKLTVSHQYGKTIRHLMKLDHSKIAADPLQASINVKRDMRAYLVIETPDVGYSVAEAKQVVDGLLAYLTATTGARITQLLGGEN